MLKKNGQVVYIKKSKLNITDMWLIPLDRVPYITYSNVVLSSVQMNVQINNLLIALAVKCW